MEIEHNIVIALLWLVGLMYFNHRNEERREYPAFYPMFSYTRLEKTKRRDQFMVSFLGATTPVLLGLINLVMFWDELASLWQVTAIIYCIWWIGITVAWSMKLHHSRGGNIELRQVNVVMALSALYGVWLVPYCFYKLSSLTTEETIGEHITEDAIAT